MGSVLVRFEKREAIEHDASSLLFGDDSHDERGDHLYDGDDPSNADDLSLDTAATRSRAGTATLLSAPPRRSVERELRRMRRRKRLLLTVVTILVIAIGASGWAAYRTLYATKDWSGSGTGQVQIQIHNGDGSAAIGATLVKDGVVRSADAYVRAAAKNSKSRDIAPGVYQLRSHMSGAAALGLLLDPAAHIVAKVVIPEGAIEKDVIERLAAALKVPVADVTNATKDIANLGIPDGYAPATGAVSSVEGFLYPDTYSLDPGTSVTAALQQMTSEFTTEDKQLGFADGAKKLNLTPYQALIIASIAQSEVKFASDAPKVARVILNRLAAAMPLQIDATSAYAAKLAGLDPAKIQYADIDSPYNTYTHAGLPPTPIGNPGEPILQGAIMPAAGDWLYYVNGDAEGHLYFTNNDTDFLAHVKICQQQKWGCG
jgi:UPF0755 protein